MICIIWHDDIPSGALLRFLNSNFLFQTTFPAILPSLPSMRQVTSRSVFVVRSVMRNEHKFLIPLWRVSITCFHCHILFSFPRIIRNSAQFFARTHDMSFLCQIFQAHLLFTGLDDVLGRLEHVDQRPSSAIPRLGDTCGARGDESDMGEPRRQLRSRKTYKMKNVWGASGVGQFLVTGPTDVATKPSHFFCRICRKDVSPRIFVALPGEQRISPRPTSEVGDARLGSAGLSGECPESSRSRAPAGEDSEGSFWRERQGVPIFWRRRCWRDWCSGPESWVDGEGSSLIEVLRLGGSYELVYQLWAQFTLSAVRLNVDVTSSRDEVLVSIYFCWLFYVACVVGCFSRSFWMGCIRGFCLAASIGQSHTGAAAWSLRRKATKCGCFFAPRT